MRILIVCGAGASSTFIARRLQRAADAEGLSLSARAGVWGDTVDERSTDLVLVGPHLADRLGEAASAADPVPVRALTEACVRDLTGREVLALVKRGGHADRAGSPLLPEGTP